MRHLEDITIKSIPHRLQAYDTSGNYGRRGKETWFEVAHLPDWRYEALVAVDELVEYFLCKDRGIKIKDIDKFDIKTVFEIDPKNQNDPGRSKHAPYHKEHMFATRIEKLLCKEFGIDWENYDKSFDNLKYE